MTKGKILELLALSAGGVGGFATGSVLAKKIIAKHEGNDKIYPMVTDYHIAKHPRLQEFIDSKLEKKAGAKEWLVKKLSGSTSVKTVAGMALLGFGAGLPSGVFYNLKLNNEKLNNNIDFDRIENAKGVSSMTTDTIMSAINKVKENRS